MPSSLDPSLRAGCSRGHPIPGSVKGHTPAGIVSAVISQRGHSPKFVSAQYLGAERLDLKPNFNCRLEIGNLPHFKAWLQQKPFSGTVRSKRHGSHKIS